MTLVQNQNSSLALHCLRQSFSVFAHRPLVLVDHFRLLVRRFLVLAFLVCFQRLELPLPLELPFVQLEVMPPLAAVSSLAQLGLYHSFRVHPLLQYFPIADQEDCCQHLLVFIPILKPFEAYQHRHLELAPTLAQDLAWMDFLGFPLLWFELQAHLYYLVLL